MKKNRGIHKILSMLLCCVMLLGLLPMTAMAAERDAMDAAIEMSTFGSTRPAPARS